MACVTVGDLRRLLEGCDDGKVVYFRIYDEREPEQLVFASDADKDALRADLKFAHQTSDGDRDVIRIYLTLDLDPCD